MDMATPKNNTKLPKGILGSFCSLYKPTDTAAPRANGKAIPAIEIEILLRQSFLMT